MSEQKLREELVAAFKNRAILYYTIFDELRQEVGEQKATAILKRAIYRRGEQIGQQFRQFAPDDFAGLKAAFMEGIPDQGRLFAPNVIRCETDGLDIQLESCPLKQIWEELGLEEHDRTIMCEIAGEIDKGTFEGAGFAFEPDTWQPGRSGCCHLHIRPPGQGV
jgi:L-2-amino-thiazoline-4-carboxylic acid hydrolase-like protein